MRKHYLQDVDRIKKHLEAASVFTIRRVVVDSMIFCYLNSKHLSSIFFPHVQSIKHDQCAVWSQQMPPLC